jgi:hypothetical protein
MCETEIEIEWRHRVSLVEAQRVLFEVIRGKETVFVEDYRVRNHGELHRRLGERYTFSNRSFNFDTFSEYFRVGAPFLNGGGDVYSDALAQSDLISIIKLTTCIHTYFSFDPYLTLEENNLYPRIFCCKKSMELTDEMVSGGDGDDGATLNEQHVQQLERFETDRSDNNLGLKFVHKVYFFTNGIDGIRVCLYAILDEFGNVRYEIGVEKEFGYVEADAASTLKQHMRECSIEIHKIVQLLQYVECPRINLTTGWLNDNNTSNATLRSLSCRETATKHIKLYETYLNDLLNYEDVNNDKSNAFCLIKFKIDGTRCFAVYNGAHHLCLDNGVELDLREYIPSQEPNYRSLFSTHFVYQLEEQNSVYFLTDVLAVRNRYSSIIQPPLYTFASSVQRYKKHAGQEWPYCLVGTDLTKNTKLVERLVAIRRCVGAATNGQTPNPENQGFVPLTINESRHMLSAIQRHPAVRTSTKFHVNIYWLPKDIYRSVIVKKRFGYYQFLYSYQHLINLFNQHEKDYPVVARLWEKFQSIMLSTDLKCMQDINASPDPTEDDFDWFYKLDVPKMFRHIDGLLLFKRTTASKRRNDSCSFTSLLNHSNYEAYKIKTFQTIELMYAEHKSTRWFKTDDFYHKYYFIDNGMGDGRGGDGGGGGWYRFDGSPINLFVPQVFLPLISCAVYEILCEDENTFYLVKRRTDKTIPDSHYKVNSIVFGRQLLQDVFTRQQKKRKRSAVSATTMRNKFANLSIIREDEEHGRDDDDESDSGDGAEEASSDSNENGSDDDNEEEDEGDDDDLRFFSDRDDDDDQDDNGDSEDDRCLGATDERHDGEDDDDGGSEIIP